MLVPLIRRIVPGHRITTLPQSDPAPHAAWIAAAQKAIRSTFAYLGIQDPLSVELLFVDEETIQTLNRTERGKDAVTDVLSFPALPIHPGEQPRDAAEPDDYQAGRIALGSIVICTRRAIEQAEAYGHSPVRECAFLAAHSALHLLGSDHETSPEDESQMFALQDKILQRANILR